MRGWKGLPFETRIPGASHPVAVDFTADRTRHLSRGLKE